MRTKPWRTALSCKGRGAQAAGGSGPRPRKCRPGRAPQRASLREGLAPTGGQRWLGFVPAYDGLDPRQGGAGEQGGVREGITGGSFASHIVLRGWGAPRSRNSRIAMW